MLTRRCAVLAGAGLLAAGLSGCGGDAPAAAADGAAAAAQVASTTARGATSPAAAAGPAASPPTTPATPVWQDPADAKEPVLPSAEDESLDRLAGQLVITAIHRTGAQKDPGLAQRAATGLVGGVIISDSGTASPGPAVRRLQSAARGGGQPPLLVSVDQEGGIVRRLRNVAPVGSAERFGRRPASTSADVARTAGCAMGRRGITLDLAPVADVATRRDGFLAENERAYGSTTSVVGSHVAAFSRGLQQGGVGSTLKHFPGLGAVKVSSDVFVGRAVEAPASVRAFRTGIDAGADAVMLASSTYRSGRWATGRPAVLSPTVSAWLRKAGFEGVIITDDLDANGVKDSPAFGNAAVDAIKAGVDELLFVDETGQRAESARRQIVAAVRAGSLSRARVEQAWKRVLRLKYRLGVRAAAASCGR